LALIDEESTLRKESGSKRHGHEEDQLLWLVVTTIYKLKNKFKKSGRWVKQ
jgi:hypothetical protein